MRFCNIQAFNLALLGKQGWRLLTNPDRLITRLNKDRYFQRSDFLGAKVDHSPSYAWRSIWSSQFLFKEGNKWNIGNGGDLLSIWSSLWHDNCLCHGESLGCPDNLDGNLANLRVIEVVRPECKEWDEEALAAVLDMGSIEKIKKVPLSILHG